MKILAKKRDDGQRDIALIDFSLLITSFKSLLKWVESMVVPFIVLSLICTVLGFLGYFIYQTEKYGFVNNYKWYAVNSHGREFELVEKPKVEDFMNLQQGKCLKTMRFPLILKPGEKAEGPFYYLVGYKSFDGREDRSSSAKYFICFTDRVELERKM